MRSYGAANLKQKAGRVIGGGLILISLALAAGPAAAQEPFQALFGEGYAILYKKEQTPIAKVSALLTQGGAGATGSYTSPLQPAIVKMMWE